VTRAGGILQRWPRELTGYAFIAPTLLFLALVVALPLASTIKLSFEELEFRTRATSFVGLANYAELLDDRLFWRSLGNSFLFALGSTAGHLVVGLCLALLLQGRWMRTRLRNLARGLLILPWLFSLAAAALIWGLLYQATGPINHLLVASGLVGTPVDFLGDPSLALWSLVLVNVWKAYPFYMVMIMGGLQAIPGDLYEAARIDGAGAWQRFRYVTLPLLRPIIVATTALDMITTFTTFDLVKIMTNGGPMRSTQTLTFYIWQAGLRDVNFGYAAAMSVAMLLILGMATLFYLRLVSRGIHASIGAEI
jgi:multiple sugar transport system permease protein